MSAIRPLIERQLAITKELHRREFARSCSGRGTFHHFVKHAWPVIAPSKKFIDGRVVQIMCEALEAVWWGQVQRLLINVPPRTLKSTLLNVLYPAWAWVQEPGHQFMTLSASENIAVRDALWTRILLTSQWYQDHWGGGFELRKDENAKNRYSNSRGGYRLAFPIGARLTGEGADTITIDDPHDAKEVRSDLKRVQVIEDYREKIDSRLNDREHGKIIAIMQRLHAADLSGHILDNLADVPFETIILPMQYDGPRYVSTIGLNDWRKQRGELLFPERFSRKSVDQWEAILGKYGAAGQLQQSPSPREGGILPRSAWRVWTERHLPAMQSVILSFDTSLKDAEDNDPTAFAAFGTFEFEEHDPEHPAYGHTRVGCMLIKGWAKHLRLSQMKSHALEEIAEFRKMLEGDDVDEILVEDKAAGPLLIQELDAVGVTCFAYNPGKLDKVTRTLMAADIFDDGLVFVPGKPLLNSDKRDDTLLPAWAEEFVAEAALFPNGANDDRVDVCVQAVRRLRERGDLVLTADLPAPEDDGEDDWPGSDEKFVNPYS